MNSHVIKVGWENASDPRTAAWIAEQYRSWMRLAVAISALRTKPLNTTTELLRAQDAYAREGIWSARPILDELFRVHQATLKEAWMLDSELEDKLHALFEATFPHDLDLWAELTREFPWYAKEQRFVGYGEVMSAHVLSHLLESRYQVANTLIAQPLYGNRRELSSLLRDDLGKKVATVLEWNSVAVVPGYQTVYGKSILQAYGRGYTDKIAERIAVGLSHAGHSPVLHIQKQVPLLSSNPKFISWSVPLRNLSYASGAEITWARWANAQVLNEYTISPELAGQKVPIWVYNPFDEVGAKTVIDTDGAEASGITFIDGRDHVATITVSGFSMSAPGLLSNLTDLFAGSGISIDSISSSETEVTFTTYGILTPYLQTSLSEHIQKRLPDAGFSVEVKNNLWLIYCIGDNLKGHPGTLEKIAWVLAEGGIDIECISQSRWQRAVTIWVSSEHLRRWVALLHASLIEKNNMS